MKTDKDKTPSIPPQDGRRVLILHHVSLYNSDAGNYVRSGLKWTDARWISDKARTGAAPHYEPWAGSASTSTTEHISLDSVVGWTDIPDVFNLTGTQKTVS
jgi:hypothetical protein